MSLTFAPGVELDAPNSRVKKEGGLLPLHRIGVSLALSLDNLIRPQTSNRVLYLGLAKSPRQFVLDFLIQFRNSDRGTRDAETFKDNGLRRFIQFTIRRGFLRVAVQFRFKFRLDFREIVDGSTVEIVDESDHSGLLHSSFLSGFFRVFLPLITYLLYHSFRSLSRVF